MLLAGVAITLALLFASNTKSTPTQSFSYTQFLSQVKANKVKTASIDSNGGVSGALSDGDNYTSQIPTALADNSLAGILESHNVDITGVGLVSSFWVDVLSLLPLRLLRRPLHLARSKHAPAAGRRHHGHRRFKGEGLRRGQAVRHASATSPATREPSRRSWRWSTS